VFKKTLLAVTVGAALGSVGAHAATFSFTPNAFSTEAAQNLTNIQVPDITVTFGAEYENEDVITFTFSEDIVDGTFATAINMVGQDSDGNDETRGTLNFVNKTDDSVTYRVSGVAADATITGTEAVLTNSGAGEELLVGGAAARAAGGVTATYAATTGISGLDLDGGSQAVDRGTATAPDTSLVSFASQWGTAAATTAFNATIDVNPASALVTDRSIFTDGGYVDSAVVAFAENDLNGTAAGLGQPENRARAIELVVTLAGDFSYMVDTNPSVAGVQQASGALSASVVEADFGSDQTVQAVLNEALTEATFEFDIDSDDQELGDVTINLDNAENVAVLTYNAAGTAPATTGAAVAMPRNSYSVSGSVSYAPLDADTIRLAGATDALADADYGDTNTEAKRESAAIAAAAAGKHDLSGAAVTVYSMPINNAAVTNYVYVTNTSVLSGEVSMVATLADGTTVSATDIATVGAGAITNITPQIEAALAGADGKRATVELTFNVPNSSVIVTAAYKVGTDRLPIETSQSLSTD
jgi:hypothetical protein